MGPDLQDLQDLHRVLGVLELEFLEFCLSSGTISRTFKVSNFCPDMCECSIVHQVHQVQYTCYMKVVMTSVMVA